MTPFKKLCHFFRIPKTPWIAQVIWFLSVATLIIGGCLFIYSTIESISFTLKFPAGSQLLSAVWLIHTSVRILAFWMPLVLILIRWSSQHIVIGLIYLVGCAVAIILSIAATIIIDVYTKPGKVQEEYIMLVNNSLNSNKRFPPAVRNMISFEHCCGWFGSLDFGTVFIVEEYINDITFMKEDIQPCYGYIFTVSSSAEDKEKLEIHDGPSSKENILQGCNKAYKHLFRHVCQYVLTVGMIVDGVAVIFIILYIILFISGKRISKVQQGEPKHVIVEEKSEKEKSSSSSSSVPTEKED